MRPVRLEPLPPVRSPRRRLRRESVWCGTSSNPSFIDKKTTTLEWTDEISMSRCCCNASRRGGLRVPPALRRPDALLRLVHRPRAATRGAPGGHRQPLHPLAAAARARLDVQLREPIGGPAPAGGPPT